MKNLSLLFLASLCIPLMAQQNAEPLIIPNLYAWKLTPNGKWLAGGSSEASDVYNLETKTLETYYGAKYGTITNSGILAVNGMGKPAILINGEVVVPEGFQKARSGSIQYISSSGNRICGNINYPELGINGMFVCDIDENGVVGVPKPLPRPSEDFFGCKPQFVNMQAISADGSTITGFVQDWRGFYCYPIIFREQEDGEWGYSYPTESLFNPYNYPIPENPWLNEPKYPQFTDYMTQMAKDAYNEAMEKFYMGYYPDIPDAKDFMTEEQWEAYYQAALAYNEWYDGQQEKINTYTKEYNKILFSSVIFGLNEIAISPDGNLIGCSYLEYPDGNEQAGIIKINTLSSEYQKYQSEVSDIYPTQVLNDGTILIAQPMIVMQPETYIILPDKNEIFDIKDYFEDTYPEYLAWIKEYVGCSGTIYTNEDMTIFSGSVLPADCLKVEEITGGYFAFTYVFSPEISSVESIETKQDKRYKVFTLQGYQILDTNNREELKTLSKGIYVINGKVVNIR